MFACTGMVTSLALEVHVLGIRGPAGSLPRLKMDTVHPCQDMFVTNLDKDGQFLT